jgi:hypothetical protein
MGKVTTKVKKTELVKMGRPTKFDISLFKEVCTKIAEGNPLKTILRSDEKYPHWTTFYEWIRADDKLPEEDRLGLSILIAHAREDGHDAIAEETLEIADDASNDWMEKFDKDGKNIGWELNGEHIKTAN